MASKRYAKRRAKIKSRQVYRTNIRRPKRHVVKKFATFVGKSTYKAARSTKRRRIRRRRSRIRRNRRRRRY